MGLFLCHYLSYFSSTIRYGGANGGANGGAETASNKHE